ncbi:hypothetical protein B0H13DRAFT_2689822 [Mycena leptocephala]|nr:hypothetical protein B0H13DRAFT_2689822 [Mycena leptocephala]
MPHRNRLHEHIAARIPLSAHVPDDRVWESREGFLAVFCFLKTLLFLTAGDHLGIFYLRTTGVGSAYYDQHHNLAWCSTPHLQGRIVANEGRPPALCPPPSNQPARERIAGGCGAHLAIAPGNRHQHPRRLPLGITVDEVDKEWRRWSGEARALALAAGGDFSGVAGVVIVLGCEHNARRSSFFFPLFTSPPPGRAICLPTRPATPPPCPPPHQLLASISSQEAAPSLHVAPSLRAERSPMLTPPPPPTATQSSSPSPPPPGHASDASATLPSGVGAKRAEVEHGRRVGVREGGAHAAGGSASAITSSSSRTGSREVIGGSGEREFGCGLEKPLRLAASIFDFTPGLLVLDIVVLSSTLIDKALRRVRATSSYALLAPPVLSLCSIPQMIHFRSKWRPEDSIEEYYKPMRSRAAPSSVASSIAAPVNGTQPTPGTQPPLPCASARSIPVVQPISSQLPSPPQPTRKPQPGQKPFITGPPFTVLNPGTPWQLNPSQRLVQAPHHLCNTDERGRLVEGSEPVFIKPPSSAVPTSPLQPP